MRDRAVDGDDEVELSDNRRGGPHIEVGADDVLDRELAWIVVARVHQANELYTANIQQRP